MATRARAKKVPDGTPAELDACTTELFTELRKQRDEITALTQRAAAADERVFHVTTGLKDAQQDIKHLEEKLYDTRARLTELERRNKKHEDQLRADTRNAIQDISTNVKELKKQASDSRAANVAGTLTRIRADSLVSV